MFFGIALTIIVLTAVIACALCHHDLKVVYVTAYDDLPVSEAIAPILRKPVAPDTLVTTVRRELSAVA
jgi:hypothetical protein